MISQRWVTTTSPGSEVHWWQNKPYSLALSVPPREQEHGNEGRTEVCSKVSIELPIPNWTDIQACPSERHAKTTVFKIKLCTSATFLNLTFSYNRQINLSNRSMKYSSGLTCSMCLCAFPKYLWHYDQVERFQTCWRRYIKMNRLDTKLLYVHFIPILVKTKFCGIYFNKRARSFLDQEEGGGGGGLQSSHHRWWIFFIEQGGQRSTIGVGCSPESCTVQSMVVALGLSWPIGHTWRMHPFWATLGSGIHTAHSASPRSTGIHSTCMGTRLAGVGTHAANGIGYCMQQHWLEQALPAVDPVRKEEWGRYLWAQSGPWTSPCPLIWPRDHMNLILLSQRLYSY